MATDQDRRQRIRHILLGYVLFAAIVVAGLVTWSATRPGPPTFEAEPLAVNDEGALFRVTATQGGDGRPLRWDDVAWSFPMEPLIDTDGIVGLQEPFFVYAAEPGMVHVITAAFEGRLLWTGAFTSLEEEDEPYLATVLPDDLPPEVAALAQEIGNQTSNGAGLPTPPSLP